MILFDIIYKSNIYGGPSKWKYMYFIDPMKFFYLRYMIIVMTDAAGSDRIGAYITEILIACI